MNGLWAAIHLAAGRALDAERARRRWEAVLGSIAAAAALATAAAALWWVR